MLSGAATASAGSWAARVVSEAVSLWQHAARLGRPTRGSHSAERSASLLPLAAAFWEVGQQRLMKQCKQVMLG